MDTASQVMVSIVSGVFVAAVASAVTAHFAFRRFYSERWWDRKAAAYSDIIETLYELVYAPGRIWDQSLDRGWDSFEPGELEELEERYDAAGRAVGKAVAAGSFVISARAVEILQGYRKEQGEGWRYAEREHGALLGYDFARSAAWKALTLMREEAQRDLRVDREL